MISVAQDSTFDAALKQPNSFPTWRRDVTLALILAFAVVAATFIGYTNTTSLHIAADDEARFVFRGFYAAEEDTDGPFRWTGGSGNVCVEQFGGARAGARVRLLANYAVPIGVDRVHFALAGRPLAGAALPASSRDYHLLLAGSSLPSGDVCLSVLSPTTAVAGDPRTLGVPIQTFAIQRFARPLATPGPFQLLLNVAGALLLFTFGRCLGIDARWLSGIIAFGALLISIGIASGYVHAGASVTRAVVPVVALGAALAAVEAARRYKRWVPAWTFTGVDRTLARDLAAMAFWSAVLVGSVWLIQMVQGRHGVWPLKAGVDPRLTFVVIVPIVLFTVWLTLVLQFLRRDDVNAGMGVLLVLAGAVVLPTLLKVSVRGVDSIFYTFRDNPTDYIHDVARVGNPITFLGQYVAISPTLAWHNANHPPGSVLLLWVAAKLFGPGSGPASIVAVVLGCFNVVAAVVLGVRLVGVKRGVLAGALVAVMPGFQIYQVTSMDTIFNATIALSAVMLFLAFEPGASPVLAAVAGALIALALLFTYATTQLVWFGAALTLLVVLRTHSPWQALRPGLIAGATLVSLLVLLYVGTGFNIVEGALRATANNSRFIQRAATTTEAHLLISPTLSQYFYFLGVNIIPYAWYLAPWGLAALTPTLRASWGALRGPGQLHSLALGLAAWVLGMWLSGLFIREVERIWGFTYPLVAVLIACYVWRGSTARICLWRAGLWLSLFFAQTLVFRLLLNTYW